MAGPHHPPGRIRIVGGTLRNSRLAVPDAPGLRPTPDRVRETLFNWLQAQMPGARCLDLYAGTGALGIEAVSRGAREVVLVERDPRLAQGLRENVARLRIEPSARVVLDSAERFLAAGPAAQFDVAFLDPPFDSGAWSGACAALEQGGWFAPNASVYLESPAGTQPPVPDSWVLHREGRAGDVRFALYRRNR